MDEPSLADDAPQPDLVVFHGDVRIAAGPFGEAALAAKKALEGGILRGLLAFNAATGVVVDLDLRGSESDVLARYARAHPGAAKRGRPKLGVVAREVTLLPRHWAWLAEQPGGASVALRKLVEAARKEGEAARSPRARLDAAYRFMAAMAGDRPGFEEASRALFAGREDALEALMRPWPSDVADQVLSYLRPPSGRS